MSYMLRSRIRPREHAAGFDQESRELVAEADTYEAAYEELQAQLPEGWLLLGIDRYLEDKG